MRAGLLGEAPRAARASRSNGRLRFETLATKSAPLYWSKSAGVLAQSSAAAFPSVHTGKRTFRTNTPYSNAFTRLPGGAHDAHARSVHRSISFSRASRIPSTLDAQGVCPATPQARCCGALGPRLQQSLAVHVTGLRRLELVVKLRWPTTSAGKFVAVSAPSGARFRALMPSETFPG